LRPEHLQERCGEGRPVPTGERDELAYQAAELPTLRAIASADLHDLVFQLGGDTRIIPAVLNRQAA
jgi:hypothetical protein